MLAARRTTYPTTKRAHKPALLQQTALAPFCPQQCTYNASRSRRFLLECVLLFPESCGFHEEKNREDSCIELNDRVSELLDRKPWPNAEGAELRSSEDDWKPAPQLVSVDQAPTEEDGVKPRSERGIELEI